MEFIKKLGLTGKSGFLSSSIYHLVKRIVSLTIVVCAGISGLAYAQPLSSPEYNSLRAEFLNINPSYLSVIDLSSYYGDASQDFPQMAGGRPIRIIP